MTEKGYSNQELADLADFYRTSLLEDTIPFWLPRSLDTECGGYLTARDRDGSCGQKYDPLIRPWYLGASNGPKNVIFILDSSGSMGQNGRMDLMKTAAKQVVDSLTFADYFGIVDFDNEARTMKGLNFLAPAASGFRMEAKIFIDKLEDSGGKLARGVHGPGGVCACKTPSRLGKGCAGRS